MFEQIFISLWYSSPIAWIAYMLAKFFIGFMQMLRSKNHSESLKKAIKWRLFFISIGLFFSLSFLLIWNFIVWFPNIELPLIIRIICLILLLPYMGLTVLSMGLGKAVGAGSISAASIVNKAIEDIKKEYSIEDSELNGAKPKKNA